MDLLTFTAETIKALAWPASVLLLVIMLRKPIVELIPLLRRLKYKELELEFSQEVAELKAEVSTAPYHPEIPVQPSPGGEVTAIHLPERLEARRGELVRMVGISPRVAIMEAWLEVESATIEVARSFWNVASTDGFKSFPRMGEYLLQTQVIDQNQLKTFRRLQQLRNTAAHEQELRLSEADARTYVELAIALAAHIRAH
ncbi:MAG TPA: hypothetical protein VIL60_00010 [Rhodanobacter sp.]